MHDYGRKIGPTFLGAGLDQPLIQMQLSSYSSKEEDWRKLRIQRTWFEALKPVVQLEQTHESWVRWKWSSMFRLLKTDKIWTGNKNISLIEFDAGRAGRCFSTVGRLGSHRGKAAVQGLRKRQVCHGKFVAE